MSSVAMTECAGAPCDQAPAPEDRDAGVSRWAPDRTWTPADFGAGRQRSIGQGLHARTRRAARRMRIATHTPTSPYSPRIPKPRITRARRGVPELAVGFVRAH